MPAPWRSSPTARWGGRHRFNGTGERASDSYFEERNPSWIGGFLLEDEYVVRFTIQPGFIEQDMSGDFMGATILMMRCDIMRVLGTAQAFLNKGACAIVGFNGKVFVQHNDYATSLPGWSVSAR